ncbi:MAG: hypothetical protein Q4E36_06275 [Bacillota bacterium]|nr:hypothetical protein [Bacillota bacterium]
MSRNSRKQKIKTTEKIVIICEGQSEECYIRSLLKENNLQTENISYYNLNGGGYKIAQNYLERNSKLINIALVVMDLDRATSVPNEKNKLKRLISLLEKLNIKNNIFLSYENFENWVAACINVDVAMLKRLSYAKGNGVYNFICNNNGSFQNAKDYFEKLELYYKKIDPNKKGVFNEDRIDKENSSLYYFLDYCKVLLRK